MLSSSQWPASHYGFSHLFRHTLPVLPQPFPCRKSRDAELAAALHSDKGAIARRTASLERKGYLRREPNPRDGRSQLLFPTEKAEGLRNAKAESESAFYDYLMAGLEGEDRARFLAALDVLYRRSKEESRAGFPHIRPLLERHDHE